MYVCTYVCTNRASPAQLPTVECHASLVSGGYFVKNNSYYCKKDYQKLYGIKCAKCSGYIDGMLAKAMGKSYHPHCLSCVKCK